MSEHHHGGGDSGGGGGYSHSGGHGHSGGDSYSGGGSHHHHGAPERDQSGMPGMPDWVQDNPDSYRGRGGRQPGSSRGGRARIVFLLILMITISVIVAIARHH